jgi:quercetin dioxygenase-like cupin family protein
MVETAYGFSRGDERAVEKVLLDGNLQYLHMVFGQNDGLPEHFTNAPVYMTVLRGRLSIGLDDQETHEYGAGTLLAIPEKARMNVRNLRPETLELIVVKAPAPR